MLWLFLSNLLVPPTEFVAMEENKSYDIANRESMTDNALYDRVGVANDPDKGIVIDHQEPLMKRNESYEFMVNKSSENALNKTTTPNDLLDIKVTPNASYASTNSSLVNDSGVVLPRPQSERNSMGIYEEMNDVPVMEEGIEVNPNTAYNAVHIL